MRKFITAMILSVFSLQVMALGLLDISNKDATGGLKDALTQAILVLSEVWVFLTVF